MRRGPVAARLIIMHITILFVGHTPPKLQDRFERFPPQFQDLLHPAIDGASFAVRAIVDGEPVPDPEGLEAVIITGSAYGVYDRPDWIDPMRAFIRRAYDVRLPMFGVCFGHQLIADALGGDVRKSEKGWGMGRHTYAIDQSALGDIAAPTDVSLAASHQDQVIAPPASAKTFLSSDFAPHAGLVYDNDAIISVQPHPEFDANYSKALCRLRLNNPHSEEQVVANEKTLDAPLHRAETAELVARFLKRAR